MNKLSNVELSLLLLLVELKESSGYELNKIVIERGYKDWANIGSTSIYVSLKKLLKKKFICQSKKIKTKGKGPSSNKFLITNLGKKMLVEEVYAALSKPRIDQQRFDIGLSGFTILHNPTKALNERKGALQNILKRVKKKYEEQTKNFLPINAQLLFEHSIHSIRSEIDFITHIINKISKHKEK